MKKVQVIAIAVALIFQGHVNAAHPDGVHYTRLDNPADLFGGPEGHRDESIEVRHDTMSLHREDEEDDDLLRADETAPLLLHSEIISMRPGTPKTPPPAYKVAVQGDRSELPETEQDVTAIRKVAKEERPGFFARLFRRTQSPKVEVSGELFKTDIQQRLTTASGELKEVDPLGLRYLDASLDKKLNTLDLKFTSFETKLKELLRTKESLTLKQRKQMQELAMKIEKIKNQMSQAVDNFAKSLEGKAGEKKLTKLAKNQAVVERVIKKGNVSAMELLLQHGADVTQAELDLALSNQRYKIFDLLHDSRADQNVEPSSQVVEHLFDVSVKNGDVEGIRLTANLLGDAQVESSMTDIQKQIEAVKKEIRDVEGTQGTRVNPALRINESDRSVNARIKVDTQLIATLEDRVVKLNEILGLLGDRVAFLRGVKAVNDVVAGDRPALSFAHLPSEIEKDLTEAQVRELKNTYVAGLEKVLEGFKAMLQASDADKTKLRQKIQRVENALKVAKVRTESSPALRVTLPDYEPNFLR